MVTLTAFYDFNNNWKTVCCNTFLICKIIYILKVYSKLYTLRKSVNLLRAPIITTLFLIRDSYIKSRILSFFSYCKRSEDTRFCATCNFANNTITLVWFNLLVVILTNYFSVFWYQRYYIKDCNEYCKIFWQELQKERPQWRFKSRGREKDKQRW